MANANGTKFPKYKTKDGKIVPSVTTICGNLGWSSRGLLWWGFEGGKKAGVRTGLEYGYAAGKAGEPCPESVDCEATLDDLREGVADIGNLAHALAQADIQKKPLPSLDGVDERTRKAALDAFASYLAWKERTRLEVVAAEVKLVSEKYRYGGRTDAIVIFGGAPGILDFKSSKELYPDAVVQVAAYSEAWTETKPDLATTHHHVLRWGPDGAFAHHALSNTQIEAGWKAFQHALALHGLQKICKGEAVTK
jgi:hypothetical protein